MTTSDTVDSARIQGIVQSLTVITQITSKQGKLFKDYIHTISKIKLSIHRNRNKIENEVKSRKRDINKHSVAIRKII